MEANSTGGQGSRRAVAPSDDDDSNSVHIVTSEAHAAREFRLAQKVPLNTTLT